jgi:hypothetical protein
VKIVMRNTRKVCRYPADKLMATLSELSEQLPDEALSLREELRKTSIAHDQSLCEPLSAPGLCSRRHRSVDRIYTPLNPTFVSLFNSLHFRDVSGSAQRLLNSVDDLDTCSTS